MMRHIFVLLCALSGFLLPVNISQAQIGYGVDSTGTLFWFDVNAPAAVTVLGPVGFVPEGIDFRPSSNTLYAIDIGANTAQLYTLNISNGAATPIGAGFASSGIGYNLTGSQHFGFDFDPTSLQGDTSMRIRLLSTNGVNMRLNSSTGAVDGVDSPLNIGGDASFVDAAAYINNIATAGGATTLFDMDSRNDKVYTQVAATGAMTEVGPFGATIDGTVGIQFDIYTTPGSADATIGGDFGFAVYERPDAPIGGPLGAYLLYHVNLSTGATTQGALVGPAATPSNFDGGFAIAPVPEPSSIAIGLVGIFGALLARWKAHRGV